MERRLGNIFGFTGGNYAGNVYDKNYMCPTLNTMQGGCKQPMIIDDTYASREPRVYDDFSPALRSEREGFKTIVAMRGRNPENPSDRTVGSPTEQRLEPNSQGICNTLTSVQKDNLVLEKDVSALRMVRTEEGKALRKQYESGEIKHAFNEHRVAEPRTDGVSNTLSTVQKDNMLLETVKIKQATSQGYIECEIGGVADLSFPDSKTRRGRVQENGQVSPTLMAGEQDICRIEKTEVLNPLKGLSDNGWHFEQNVYDSNGLVRSVKAGGGSGNIPKVVEQYRIRKLTPLECWRLMDFKEEDFHKAAEVNSNTQLYKQAGNSIIVNVLVAIMGQMIPGKENVYKEIST